MFDSISPAVVAADHTVSEMLVPDRAARLVQQRAQEPSQPGLHGVLSDLVSSSFGEPSDNTYHAELSRSVQRVIVDRVIGLAVKAQMPQVRAIADYHLTRLAEVLEAETSDVSESAHRAALLRTIRNHRESPRDGDTRAEPLAAPPGAPIGQAPTDWMGTDYQYCSGGSW